MSLYYIRVSVEIRCLALNPPLGPVEVVQATLVLLHRAADRRASRVVVLIAVLQRALPLPRLRLH